jgi:hypothetical protein
VRGSCRPSFARTGMAGGRLVPPCKPGWSRTLPCDERVRQGSSPDFCPRMTTRSRSGQSPPPGQGSIAGCGRRLIVGGIGCRFWEDVSLQVAVGEIAAVVGARAQGKTTPIGLRTAQSCQAPRDTVGNRCPVDARALRAPCGQGTVALAWAWVPSRNAKDAANGKPPRGQRSGRRRPSGW